MYAQVGETIEHTQTLTEEEIIAFAHAVGDQNPLHFDTTLANASRFGGIIACGPHLVSILIAQAANHFSQGTTMVGLEFSSSFQAPALPGVALVFSWEVTEVVEKEKLNGDIVSLAGNVCDATGKILLRATGKILVAASL